MGNFFAERWHFSVLPYNFFQLQSGSLSERTNGLSWWSRDRVVSAVSAARKPVSVKRLRAETAIPQLVVATMVVDITTRPWLVFTRVYRFLRAGWKSHLQKWCPLSG